MSEVIGYAKSMALTRFREACFYWGGGAREQNLGGAIWRPESHGFNLLNFEALFFPFAISEKQKSKEIP